MIIGHYYTSFGDQYWAAGESVESVLEMIEGDSGDHIKAESVTWYNAKEFKVKTEIICIPSEEN